MGSMWLLRTTRLTMFFLIFCIVYTGYTLEIGSLAPDFELTGVDGETYTLESFDHYDFLAVIFSCNHCPTSQAYENRIKTLVDKYEYEGLGVVVIAPNNPLALEPDDLAYTDLSDSYEEMQQRAQDKDFNFPYLYDGDEQTATEAYNPIATPHVFLFNENRMLVYSGSIDDHENPEKLSIEYLDDAIKALLAEVPPDVEKTNPFGCEIKWKKESTRSFVAKSDTTSPQITAITLDSLKFMLTNQTGKLRLVNLWATWNESSHTLLTELATLYNMYKGRDFEVLTICMETPLLIENARSILKNSNASLKNFIFTNEITTPIQEIIDPEWEREIPYTILLNPGGQILYRNLGAIKDTLPLKRAIVDYLGRY